MNKLLQEIHHEMIKKNLTLATAESLTGGMLGSHLTSLPGSSAYFLGGIISYSDSVKKEVLRVSEKILKQESAVSDLCAKQMAEGCRQILKTDIAISLTGLAGPDADPRFPHIPIGRVYIGIANIGGNTRAFEENFNAELGRNAIRESTCLIALQHLLEIVRSFPK